MSQKIILEGVREYGDGEPVQLEKIGERLAVTSVNEGGYNSTSVDLEDLLVAIVKLLKTTPFLKE